MEDNRLTWADDKMLSWTVLKYVKVQKELQFFTKPVSTMEISFVFNDIASIENTGRSYRLDTVNKTTLLILNGTLEINFIEERQSHHFYLNLYNRQMFDVQSGVY